MAVDPSLYLDPCDSPKAPQDGAAIFPFRGNLENGGIPEAFAISATSFSNASPPNKTGVAFPRRQIAEANSAGSCEPFPDLVPTRRPPQDEASANLSNGIKLADFSSRTSRGQETMPDRDIIAAHAPEREPNRPFFSCLRK